MEETSKIDSTYYLVNSTHLIGKSRSVIAKIGDDWRVSTWRGENIYQIKSEVLPTGIREWRKVSITNSTSLFLHQNLEQPGHFCCSDANCFPSEFVCNRFKNCEDHSDEKYCNMQLPENYDRDYPSPQEGLKNVTSKYLNISTQIKIGDIISVDPVKGEITIFVRKNLGWFDRKLRFLFLNNARNKNFINKTNEQRIWIPRTDYMYLKSKREAFRRLTIKRMEEPHLSGDIDVLQPMEIYEGSKNRLELATFEKITFLCTFVNIKNYPFGIDKCEVDLYLDNTDNFDSTLDPVYLG